MPDAAEMPYVSRVFHVGAVYAAATGGSGMSCFPGQKVRECRAGSVQCGARCVVAVRQCACVRACGSRSSAVL